MEKINSFKEVLLALKDKEILTTKIKDKFVFKKGKIYCYTNGSSFSLDVDDFIDLYKDEVFYIYEEEGASIDEDKDEAYYRYYRK